MPSYDAWRASTRIASTAGIVDPTFGVTRDPLFSALPFFWQAWLLSYCNDNIKRWPMVNIGDTSRCIVLVFPTINKTMEPEDSSSTATAAEPKMMMTGIDIQKALDILADPSSQKSHDHDHHDHSASSGGCHDHQQTDDLSSLLKSMGQTIDLAAQTPVPQQKNDAQDEGKKAEDEQRRKERAAQLLAELKSMSVKELLQTVLETQQQRVATYQGYNE
jgi:hypothetical protein